MKPFQRFATFFLLFIVLVHVEAQLKLSSPIPLCQDQSYLQDNCLRKCDHPDYEQCSDFFTLQYDPKFCAQKKDGTYFSYTHECQACKNSNVVAVMNGKCSCQLENRFDCKQECKSDNECKSFQMCMNGACLDKCAMMRCANCYQGECGVTQCKTQKECQSYEVCTQNICRDKCTHMFCAGGSCYQGQCQLPTLGCQSCKSYETCIRGVCQDRCALMRCAGKCYQGQCQPLTSECQFCKSYETCISGICQDRCVLLRCAGSCYRGQCQPLTSECQSCKSYEICIKGVCHDKCSLMRCAGKCYQGQCQPLTSECQSCKPYEICISGTCQDRCALMRCAGKCQKGKCIGNSCTFSKECKNSEFCISGTCKNKCDFLKCKDCYNGKCGVRQCKSDKSCKSYENCVNGICEDICKSLKCSNCHKGKCGNKQCKTSFDCGFRQKCKKGRCVKRRNRCRNVKCKKNQKCFHGICIHNISSSLIPSLGAFSPILLNKCANVKCRKNHYCINGKCVKKPQICILDAQCPKENVCISGKCTKKVEKHLQVETCPAKSDSKTTYCQNPRPKCPVVVYFRAPDAMFCGVKANGERVNFVTSCEACQDQDIVYYFDKPCHKAPFVCEKGQNCLDYYCSKKCSTNLDCPLNWMKCFNGKCIDKCDHLRCLDCKYGQCAYSDQNEKCTNYSECPKGKHCVGFECIDLCQRKTCPYGSICIEAKCKTAQEYN